ncbi:hypothetical protein IGA_01578 [Bacillus cereus HuA3-9]|uniref:Uncharacterized protein n=3 Tax=Bacillus cereus group TaxID=86661 RepID=R8DAV8_BACCE|nr:hypothetical protein IG3_01852 [Bacillus cereus HuA2-1]EOO16541.1 hypothetical protein IG9_02723 [Bacillus cereus HuA2-9]EOO20857.1 hypothetical protein IGA_01578 [Bacillus cereus HuA3-9]
MKVKAQDSIVNQSQEQGNTYENNATKVSEDYFTGDFNLDLEVIKKQALDNSDVYCREFNIGGTSIRAVLVFVEGLSDKDLIDTHIMKSWKVKLRPMLKGIKSLSMSMCSLWDGYPKTGLSQRKHLKIHFSKERSNLLSKKLGS